MNKTSISIMISQAPEKTCDQYKQPSLLEKIQDYMTMVKSTENDCEHELKYLQCLYKKLSRTKTLPAELIDILQELEDLLMIHDHTDGADMDAQYMHRWQQSEQEDD